MPLPIPLTASVVTALNTADPHEKARLTRQLVASWRADRSIELGDTPPPARPARPAKPALLPPRDVPRRRITASDSGRIALLHAIAHIELNAIDLALDMACRYIAQGLPRDFYSDWLGVADDESRHFLMLSDRLAALGASYGDLPAHDGLWQAADATKNDLLARLAIAPLVLEARGLDVTPAMMEKFQRAGDEKSARMLSIIYEDEKTHVFAGSKWFLRLCNDDGLDPAECFRKQLKNHFGGALKPPFNIEARDEAGLPRNFYVDAV